MLISEHVVSHQKSDWGDNINSSQMFSNSYYTKNKNIQAKMQDELAVPSGPLLLLVSGLSCLSGKDSPLQQKTTEIQYYIDSLVKVTWPHG